MNDGKPEIGLQGSRPLSRAQARRLGPLVTAHDYLEKAAEAGLRGDRDAQIICLQRALALSPTGDSIHAMIARFHLALPGARR